MTGERFRLETIAPENEETTQSVIIDRLYQADSQDMVSGALGARYPRRQSIQSDTSRGDEPFIGSSQAASALATLSTRHSQILLNRRAA